jgi:uncharacterized membrane protein YphA (DoxX/SURF4 family)
MATGAVCAGQGLRLLLELPAAASASGLREGDWPRWWAAAVQWDAGALVLAGVLSRPACLLGCAALTYTALAYTASHIGEHLPLITETGTARPLALTSALGLFLLACSRRQARIPPRDVRARGTTDFGPLPVH